MFHMSITQSGRCDARIDALRAELGGILAARIVEAEALEFLWEARLTEHYLGHQIQFDENDCEIGDELSRIAFVSLLEGCWYAGTCLVDGDGEAVTLLWKRSFSSFEQARDELVGTH